MRPGHKSVWFALAGIAIVCTACSKPKGIGLQRPSPRSTSHGVGTPAVPRPRHTLVVVFENHPYDALIGNSHAPVINTLARDGPLFTSSYAVTHPVEPHYHP